jgi:hypothetical protein
VNKTRPWTNGFLFRANLALAPLSYALANHYLAFKSVHDIFGFRRVEELEQGPEGWVAIGYYVVFMFSRFYT